MTTWAERINIIETRIPKNERENINNAQTINNWRMKQCIMIDVS